MKKFNLKKIVFVLMLTVSSLQAYDGFETEGYSLFGVEAGGGSLSSETTNQNTTPATFTTNTTKIATLGLKIGAQTENFRIFLNGRYAKDSDNVFDYIMNYGVELDYLFNFSRYANFFIGGNGGLTYMKLTLAGEAFSRTIANPYYGANIGFNFHATRNVDVEIASRVMMMDAANTKSGVKYQFNNAITAYISVVYKYQMD